MVEGVAQLALDGVQTGKDEHDAHLQDLVVAQWPILVAFRHEVADEIRRRITRGRPPVRDHPDEVLRHRAHRRHRPGLARGIAEGIEDRVHPVDEQHVVSRGQTHDRQEDPGRVHRREVGHELAAAPADKGVDGLVAQFAHPGGHTRDRTGREGPVEDLAIPAVLGRGDIRRNPAVARVRVQDDHRITTEDLGGLIRLPALLVTGEHPETGPEAVPADRGGLAQLRHLLDGGQHRPRGHDVIVDHRAAAGGWHATRHRCRCGRRHQPIAWLWSKIRISIQPTSSSIWVMTQPSPSRRSRLR